MPQKLSSFRYNLSICYSSEVCSASWPCFIRKFARREEKAASFRFFSSVSLIPWAPPSLRRRPQPRRTEVVSRGGGGGGGGSGGSAGPWLAAAAAEEEEEEEEEETGRVVCLSAGGRTGFLGGEKVEKREKGLNQIGARGKGEPPKPLFFFFVFCLPAMWQHPFLYPLMPKSLI